MESNVEATKNGFPSHLVPQEKKDRSWHLQYAKAFHNEYKNGISENDVLRGSANNYKKWRSYARGEQDPDQYKELLSIKKNKGKRNPSYRNLDFSILKVAPKIKDVLLGKVLNKPYEIGVRLIDPDSLNKEKQAKYEMIEFILNKDHRAGIESMGFNLPKPPDVETAPKKVEEVDSYMSEGGYKSELAAQIENYLQICFIENDYDQIKEELAHDMIDLGVYAARVYIDSNGFIRIRRGIPENMITNKCIHNNFKDKIRVGEYIPMTISDLKQRVGNNFGFTEKTYRDIAEKVSGSNGKYSYDSGYNRNDDTDPFPYDNEKITVLDCSWYSIDNETKVVRKKGGNNQLYDKNHDYVPYKGEKTKPNNIGEDRWKEGMNPKTGSFDGLKDDEYEKLFEGERKIIRNEIKNVYECMWIVDTEYVFDYGLSADSSRSANNLADVEMNWIIQTTNFQSSINKIEAALDNIQINWLQFQSHIAASKPKGMAMELRAASRLQSKGKTQKTYSFKDMITFYAETGSYFYDGYDEKGSVLPQKPFEELNNGISQDASIHFEYIFKELDLIRFQLGLNEVSDATGPSPKLGLGVSEIISDSTDNALTPLYKAFRRGVKDVAKRIIDTIPLALDRGMHTGFVEALGMDSYTYLRMNKELNLRSIGIDVRTGIDDVLKDKMYQIAINSVGKGELQEEDAIAILDMNNLWQIRKYLAKRRSEVKQENAKIQAALDQNKAQADQGSAMASKQMEAETMGIKHQNTIAELQEKSRLKQEEMMLEHTLEVEKLSKKGDEDVDIVQAKNMAKLVEINEQGEVDKELEEVRAQESNQAPKD